LISRLSHGHFFPRSREPPFKSDSAAVSAPSDFLFFLLCFVVADLYIPALLPNAALPVFFPLHDNQRRRIFTARLSLRQSCLVLPHIKPVARRRFLALSGHPSLSNFGLRSHLSLRGSFVIGEFLIGFNASISCQTTSRSVLQFFTPPHPRAFPPNQCPQFLLIDGTSSPA